MEVCHTWLAEDFYRRHGYEIVTDDRGQRWAVSDTCRWPIDPPCGHPAKQCPPFDEGRTEMVDINERLPYTGSTLAEIRLQIAKLAYAAEQRFDELTNKMAGADDLTAEESREHRLAHNVAHFGLRVDHMYYAERIAIVAALVLAALLIGVVLS